ncbi:MAG: DUF4350 domain-containing protein, partial [Solirubrobacteraceae bacterium]|nr:DUF4350 domain-containing protein [Solirubrobacteraceae bacterium]
MSSSSLARLLPRNPVARLLVVVVTFFVALNLVALAVTSVAPQPSGVDGSAYATQPRGVAAYAELLRRAGHPVDHLREPLAEARLDPARTVVVLDALGLASGERRALARFVRSGGRLVAGGRNAGRGFVPGAPRWTPTGPRSARPPAAASEASGEPEAGAVRSVVSAGDGGFAAGGGVRPLLVGGDGDGVTLLAVAEPSAARGGRALLLADSGPLQNRLLARADNAALGLALAGSPRRPVTFVESVHGFGQATGLAALPARWRVGLAIGVLAGLLWLASRARRLGPPEVTPGEPTPARREHVEALALALRRAP